jgi:hypothetical protein
MTNARYGHCPVRQLPFIRQVVPQPDRELPRCQTCGRADNCCCGAECSCPVTKEEVQPVFSCPVTKEEPNVHPGTD